jgi:hypothetical protein
MAHPRSNFNIEHALPIFRLLWPVNPSIMAMSSLVCHSLSSIVPSIAPRIYIRPEEVISAVETLLPITFGTSGIAGDARRSRTGKFWYRLHGRKASPIFRGFKAMREGRLRTSSEAPIIARMYEASTILYSSVDLRESVQLRNKCPLSLQFTHRSRSSGVSCSSLSVEKNKKPFFSSPIFSRRLRSSSFSSTSGSARVVQQSTGPVGQLVLGGT